MPDAGSGDQASLAGHPRIYSIAAHRGFADALVAGLIPRYRETQFGLARLTLLLPSRRAVRTVTEAFIRASGGEGGAGGLLMPRMVVVGDLDLDETLGPLLDPLGSEVDIPPAVDPTVRLLRIAEILRGELGSDAPGTAGILRQARSLVRSMDRMLVEDVPPQRLMELEVADDLAAHWQNALHLFARVQVLWNYELAQRNEIDAAERRNRLLDHAAMRWKAQPPAHPIVAAGVTSASPAVARLLRVVSELPGGSVVLPDLDLALDDAVWDALGAAGADEAAGSGASDAVTHPQYHLKLLLNRMGIARDEVRPWHRAGIAAAPPARSRAISNLFLPPEASSIWGQLPPENRRLSGVRVMETANPEEEAQAIAVLIRQALDVPEKRVALVTPDRGLAGRVVAHLACWNIAADDTAGRPLPQTPAGRVFLLLAEVLADHAAPVPLLGLLGHPLVQQGPGRAGWLDRVRELDLALRGPRPAPGVAGIKAAIDNARKKMPALAEWWTACAPRFEPVFALADSGHRLSLDATLDTLARVAENLCGEGLWSNADGRSLSGFVEQWRAAATAAGTVVEPAELPALLRDAMDEVAVRPPYGAHPRLAIYGLLEARMSRADLVICAGLTEGVWPASPSPDPLLAPPVLRALGIPGADFRIGLSAHDLAAALGAPEVVLSHAARDMTAPTVPSRFLMRIRAMLGSELEEETEAVLFARAIDKAAPHAPYPRPEPRPSAEQRRVDLAVTALDRLRGDPYQFYASAILGLRSLDALDAEPSPAWKGTAVHAILEEWHDSGAHPGTLVPLAEARLEEMSGHPFMRGLWRPRLLSALAWVEKETENLLNQGRTVLTWEEKGEMRVDGIRIHGRADRIDRAADGTLAVVDYKTGAPPRSAMVAKGFALQLGLIGLIAEAGGFKDKDGQIITGHANGFEYWSLARKQGQDRFGHCTEPLGDGKRRKGLLREEFLEETEVYLREAIARWILGSEPFTARLNPDLAGYADYDQLMRLDEWQGRTIRGDDGDAA